MKQIYILALLFVMQQQIYSQHQIRVLNRETLAPVEGASVYFPDSRIETTTDKDGNFIINTKVNSILVQISSINYKTFLETIKLQSGTLSVLLEPSFHDIREITVSANSSKLQGENVTNVEYINLNNNPLTEGFSLTQKLSGAAGVTNLSTGAGIGKPVIRGLSGNRIAVYSQGLRIENQQWGDEHGLGLDENGYEHVEIIKGPASLLYGSDALGGVLYFVDEHYAKNNSINALLNSEYDGNTAGWRNTGSFKLSKERFHWNLFGGHTTHQDYQDGDGNFVDNSRFYTSDFKTAFGYTGGKFISSLKYNYLNEIYGLTEVEEEAEDNYSNGREPEIPYQKLATHLISSENTVFFDNNSKLKLDFGYIFNNRKEFEERNEISDNEYEHTAPLNMDLSTFSYNLKWYSPEIKEHWKWIAGSQGMYQTNKNNGEEIIIPNATTVDMGVFATTDYYYAPDSYWQIGMRLDGRSINGKEYGNPENETYIPSLSNTYYAFNFSTGIFQSLSRSASLRASLSSGYRAPGMFELLSDGVHEGVNRYEIGDVELQTENSYQADVSFNIRNKHLEFFFNPYFNYIRNYIFLQPSRETREELPVYYYKQNDAYLFGGETGIHFHPHPLDWLHLETSYSSAYGQDTDNNHLPFMPAPKINSVINMNFKGKKTIEKFSVFLQHRYVFRQDRISEYETPTEAYSIVNTGLYSEIKVQDFRFSIHIAANNLLNKTYYDHLSRYKNEGIYNIGRNFSLKLTVPFDAKL